MLHLSNIILGLIFHILKHFRAKRKAQILSNYMKSYLKHFITVTFA